MAGWLASLDPLEVANLALVFVTIIMALATRRHARIADAQFRIAQRPRVRIDWAIEPGTDAGQPLKKCLVGRMRETLNAPVTLHWAKAHVRHSKVKEHLSQLPSYQEFELADDHTAPVAIVDGISPPDTVVIEVTASVSNANVPNTRETWRLGSVVWTPDLNGVTVLHKYQQRLREGPKGWWSWWKRTATKMRLDLGGGDPG